MQLSLIVLARFVLVLAIALSWTSNAAADIVFSDDFDGGQTLGPGVAGGFSGVTGTTLVQGYSGQGTGSNLFADEFLINGSGGNPAASTILALSGLAPHSSIDLKFLLGIIDTWDGDAFPPVPSQAPDFFNVYVDGVQVFAETFANAVASTGQSYVPPAGVELANNVQLGFRTSGTNDLDDAYDMGLDPTFSGIPHSASTLTIEWFGSGAGWNGGIATDESWAIENVQVSINASQAVPAMGSGGVLFLAVLLAMSAAVTRRRLEASQQVREIS